MYASTGLSELQISASHRVRFVTFVLSWEGLISLVYFARRSYPTKTNLKTAKLQLEDMALGTHLFFWLVDHVYIYIYIYAPFVSALLGCGT